MFPEECVVLDLFEAQVLPAYSDNRNHIGHQLSYQLRVVLPTNDGIQCKTVDPREYIGNLSVFLDLPSLS